ncbi:unnamed protein product [Amoebophrya sp. A120]|nr:unnamed protein product [Amoebophrya sp. A120]|eukprot:GSA120T00012719001.1
MESIYDIKRRMEWILQESAYVFSPAYEVRNSSLWLYNTDVEAEDAEGFSPRSESLESWDGAEGLPPAARNSALLFLIGDYMGLGYGVGEAWMSVYNMPLAFWAVLILLLVLIIHSVHTFVLVLVDSIISHFGVVGMILLSSTTWATWPQFLRTVLRALRSVDAIVERRLRTLTVCDIPTSVVLMSPVASPGKEASGSKPQARAGVVKGGPAKASPTSPSASRPRASAAVDEGSAVGVASPRTMLSSFLPGSGVVAGSEVDGAAAAGATNKSSTTTGTTNEFRRKAAVSREDVAEFFQEKLSLLGIRFRVSDMRNRGEHAECDVQFIDADFQTVLRACSLHTPTQWGSWAVIKRQTVRIRPKLGEVTAGVEYFTHFLCYLYNAFETRYWIQLSISIYLSLAMTELLVPKMLALCKDVLHSAVSASGDHLLDPAADARIVFVQLLEWANVAWHAFLLALIVSFCGYQSWADSKDVQSHLEKNSFSVKSRPSPVRTTPGR